MKKQKLFWPAIIADIIIMFLFLVSQYSCVFLVLMIICSAVIIWSES